MKPRNRRPGAHIVAGAEGLIEWCNTCYYPNDEKINLDGDCCLLLNIFHIETIKTKVVKRL